MKSKRIKSHDNLTSKLDDVRRTIENNKLVKSIVSSQPQARREVVKAIGSGKKIRRLRGEIAGLHPADIATLLEQLPLPERLAIWDLIKADYDGEVLLDLTDSVRETVIKHMNAEELVAATEPLDTDEIADLVPNLPSGVISEVFKALSAEEQQYLEEALSYPSDSVGAIMDFDMVSIPKDVNLKFVLEKLRTLESLPEINDQLIVLNHDGGLCGVLSVDQLLVSDLSLMVTQVMRRDVICFKALDKASRASNAFLRYDLLSAPVLGENGRVTGRLILPDVVNFIKGEEDSENLGRVGLRDEDLFATVWQGAKNRWTWLGVNLLTAIVASRAISLFEGSIEKLVALAALMPIVAAVAGNTGNQTVTLIVRALALGEITANNIARLFWKEVSIALLNGLIWGSVAGIFTWWLYGATSLGLVMAGALVLNLLVASLVGVMVPLILHRIGRDPAIGSAVLLGFTTDSMGFLIFLGLSTWILL